MENRHSGTQVKEPFSFLLALLQLKEPKNTIKMIFQNWSMLNENQQLLFHIHKHSKNTKLRNEKGRALSPDVMKPLPSPITKKNQSIIKAMFQDCNMSIIRNLATRPSIPNH